MTELGLTSYAYYWACRPDADWNGKGRPMGPLDLIGRTAELGLNVLQICENVPTFSPSDDRQVGALREKGDAVGVRLELGCRAQTAETLRPAVAQAAALGSGLLRVVPWSGKARRSDRGGSELVTALTAVLPDCERLRVRLAIENYFDLSDAELVDLVAGLDSEWVGVVLDTANSVGRLSDPLETAQTLARYAISVHLKDFEVTKPPIGYRVSGTPLGEGLLDVAATLGAVFASSHRPALLIELWVDPETDPAATLRKEDDWVIRSVDYARRALQATHRPAGA